jgi:ferredoxin
MDFITIFIKDKTQNKREFILPNDPAFSLMEMLRASELPVLGTCGGIALCASCHIYVLSDNALPKQNEEELKLLDSLHNYQSNSRLSCQLRMNDKLHQLTIEIASV